MTIAGQQYNSVMTITGQQYNSVMTIVGQQYNSVMILRVASLLTANMLTQKGIFPNFVATLSEGHHFEEFNLVLCLNWRGWGFVRLKKIGEEGIKEES